MPARPDRGQSHIGTPHTLFPKSRFSSRGAPTPSSQSGTGYPTNQSPNIPVFDLCRRETVDGVTSDEWEKGPERLWKGCRQRTQDKGIGKGKGRGERGGRDMSGAGEEEQGDQSTVAADACTSEKERLRESTPSSSMRCSSSSYVIVDRPIEARMGGSSS